MKNLVLVFIMTLMISQIACADNAALNPWEKGAIDLTPKEWGHIETSLPLTIDKIIALGFSKKGMFAYRYHEEQTEVSDDGVSEEVMFVDLINDSVNQEDLNNSGLRQHDIAPLVHPVFGKFPFHWQDDIYTIEIREQEKIDIFFVSKKRGKKLIGSLDRESSHISGGLKAVAYIKSPFEDRIAIILGSPSIDFEDTEPRRISFHVFGGHLKIGFKQ